MRTYVVYDLKSCPEGSEINDIIKYFKKNKFVLYDSKLGNPPRIIKVKMWSLSRYFRIKLYQLTKFFRKDEKSKD